jgi:ubiquitin-protein ligase
MTNKIIIDVIILMSTYIPWLGIQELLTTPNPKSPAQREAYEDYTINRTVYDRKVREQALKNTPDT